MNSSSRVRPATRDDVPAIAAMIRELARYERAEDEVRAAATHLAGHLFAPSPAVFAQVAELDGVVSGFAVWFLTYSTWLGTHGIYLEDLYVRPEARRQGLGRRLLADLAGTCARRGYQRLEWAVLDWNDTALAFYRSLGAIPQSEWTTHRLAGGALAALAASGRPA